MRRRLLLLSLLFCGLTFPVGGVEPNPTPNEPALTNSAVPLASRIVSGQSQLPLSNWLEHLSQPLRRTDLRIHSSASCASTACHGGPRPGIAEELATRGAEYPVWLEKDPHARSWRTMCSQASLNILERLSILRDGKMLDSAAFDNCLKCHNTTRGYPAKQAHSRFETQVDAVTSTQAFHAEGIGCTGCHGPAGNWLNDHYRISWNDFDSATNGLVPNKNLLARARMCAACHIGDRDRDVNHDLIAAGHPALTYEFTTYHNMLPKHWRELERSTSIDFEAQLWIAGQIAALDASLALLESRADTRSSAGTWPEFAALDCSACHQSLRLDREDYSVVSQSRIAGLSHWNRFGVEQLLKLHQINQDSDAAHNSAVQSLAVAVQQLSKLVGSQIVPDAQATQASASQARRALDLWLSQTGNRTIENFSAEQLSFLAAESLHDRPRLESWEYAAQSYLAVIAARQAWQVGESLPTVSEARRLRQALLFGPETIYLSVPDEPGRSIKETAQSLGARLNRSPLPSMLLPELVPGQPRNLNLGGKPELQFEPAPEPRDKIEF